MGFQTVNKAQAKIDKRNIVELRMTNNDKALAAVTALGDRYSLPDTERNALEMTIRQALTPQSSADLGRVREALERSNESFKAAIADLNTAAKLIGSGYVDRMQMEVTRQRLTIIIEQNDEALRILDEVIGRE